MNLDKDTKLYLLHKHYLSCINDVLDENYQFGEIMNVDKYVRDIDNKWKQHRVDEAIKLLDEYKQKCELILKQN